MSIKDLWMKLESAVVLGMGKVKWKPNPAKLLTADELAKIQELLTNDYYIILTHRSNELSTFFTQLATFLLSGKWGYWAHALMNMEDTVNDKRDFRLIEAVGVGVKYTPFDLVFNLQGATLLKPKNMEVKDWTAILDAAKAELGKPYDTLFNIANDNALSCVELVRTALMKGDPDYQKNFPNFEALIQKNKNLAPDTYYRCGDFEPVFEVRH